MYYTALASFLKYIRYHRYIIDTIGCIGYTNNNLQLNKTISNFLWKKLNIQWFLRRKKKWMDNCFYIGETSKNKNQHYPLEISTDLCTSFYNSNFCTNIIISPPISTVKRNIFVFVEEVQNIKNHNKNDKNNK